jgi:peptide/nickel transport system substrate-binding protein
MHMKIRKGCLVLCAAAAAIGFAMGNAQAQKYGGVFRIQHMDNPPSASILEEATVSVAVPFMAVFNNLVMFDQHVAKNSLESVVPDLAASWAWRDEGRTLAFKLRQGVRWHDGKPFTAKDVQCTFDLLLSGESKLRRNPRSSWYSNVEKATADGDFDVSLHLKEPQPSLLAVLASGYSPIYPCHVPVAEMRRKPIGTGPFKLAEFKMNESIKLVKNADYWKKGLPYLDGIEYTIMPDRSTRMLSFVSGRVDMTFPTDVSVPLLKNIHRDAPRAKCTMRATGVSTNLIVNRDVPPFDDGRIRRALALTLDRKAFNDILNEGEGSMSGAMLPPPDGVWGMPQEMLKKIAGYGDVARARDEGRALMRQAGYGPARRLKVKVSTRNIATYRDPAVILIDQLKQVYIEGDLEPIDSSVWYNKIAKKDYQLGMNLTGVAVDDPDVNFYENYYSKSERNYTGYNNPEVDRLIDQQSAETDLDKRKKLVWEIEKKLAEDVARPVIGWNVDNTCWDPKVKGVNLQVNSIYNGWRFEDFWLDK